MPGRSAAVTVPAFDLVFYAGALLVLFLTPGPVWVALTARALSGGFAGAWPLAVGVALGDALWPLAAIFGLAWLVGNAEGMMELLRLVAAVIFLWMGAALIRGAGRRIDADSRLTRPGRWAGFAAGVAVIVGNPKAVLFYMGVLPGFFDLSRISPADIAAIVAMSMAIPMAGNLLVAALIDRTRRLLASDRARQRMNRTAGWLLVAVGLAIPFT